MPLKVYFGPEGPYVVADTPREAMELVKLCSNGMAHPTAQAVSGAGTIHDQDEEPDVNKVFLRINDRAKKFLTGLSAHSAGITAEKLAEEIEERPEVFGGILGGISKIAKKNRVPIGGLVISEMKHEGSRRFRFFTPGLWLRVHFGGGKKLVGA